MNMKSVKVDIEIKDDFVQIEKLEEVFTKSIVDMILNKELKDKAHIMLQYGEFATVLEEDKQALLNEINEFLKEWTYNERIKSNGIIKIHKIIGSKRKEK